MNNTRQSASGDPSPVPNIDGCRVRKISTGRFDGLTVLALHLQHSLVLFQETEEAGLGLSVVDGTRSTSYQEKALMTTLGGEIVTSTRSYWSAGQSLEGVVILFGETEGVAVLPWNPPSLFWVATMGAEESPFARILSSSPSTDLALDGRVYPVNSEDSMLRTALHYAALLDRPNVCSKLLRLGASVDTPDALHNFPIHYSALAASSATCSVLISAGAKLESQGYLKETPLHFAAAAGNLEAASFLIEAGANVNAWSASDVTPLMLASIYGFPEMISLLAHNGASIDSSANNNDCSLHGAVRYSKLDSVERLLDLGADPDTEDDQGETPLYCLGPNAVSIANILIRAGANVNHQNERGETPLHLLCSRPNVSPELLETLSKAGANPTTRNNQGSTPLDIAVRAKNEPALAFLGHPPLPIDGTHTGRRVPKVEFQNDSLISSVNGLPLVSVWGVYADEVLQSILLEFPRQVLRVSLTPSIVSPQLSCCVLRKDSRSRELLAKAVSLNALNPWFELLGNRIIAKHLSSFADKEELVLGIFDVLYSECGAIISGQANELSIFGLSIIDPA